MADKAEIVSILAERFSMPPNVAKDFMKMKKEALVELEQSTKQENNIAAFEIANAEIIHDVMDQPISEKESEKEKRWTDPDWTDYVLSHFTDEETPSGRPTCDGLRRVFELLIGEIIESNVRVVKAPTLMDPDCTVEFSIVYRDKTHAVRRITDAMNVNPQNTKSPWHKASVATATTKAESRALRKGLRLQKVLSLEEVDHGFDGETSEVSLDDISNVAENKRISNNQVSSIHNLCQKLDIDSDKLLLSFDIDSIEEATHEQGMEVLAALNKYQRGPEYGGESIPEEVLLHG